MDTTIRNLDERAYRALKAHAAQTGRTMGEVLNEAIGGYLARATHPVVRGSLLDLKPVAYPDGSERLSEEIDAIVYGG